MTATANRIRTLSRLARELADAAAKIRDELATAWSGHHVRGVLEDVLKIVAPIATDDGSELGCETSADVVAQLLVYGLFVARCDWTAAAGGADEFDARTVAALQPRIGRLLHAVEQLEPARETLHTLLSRLDHCALGRVLEQLQRHGPERDPAARFYEHFLAAYSSGARRALGVYYTPDAVVSYLVSSVDVVLRQSLGIQRGIVGGSSNASSRVQIVDPACGNGKFLAEIDAWLRRAASDGDGSSETACGANLQRAGALLGFEIQPATAAIANFLLSRATPDELRSSVHCLDPLTCRDEQMASLLGVTGDDSRSDPNGRVLAIVGNPPYGNYGRRALSEPLRTLLNDYKRGLNERKTNLNDDFIRFLRWSQHWIDRAGAGVLAFITNNTYLSGLTHRHMRRSLRETFDEIYVLDLHGSSTKRERSPDGRPDENVFDIQQGVAIGIFVKQRRPHGGAAVRHAELWGTRRAKLAVLARSNVSTTTWTACNPAPASFLFVPPRTATSETEYQRFPRLDEIFLQYVSGVQTKRDGLFVGFSREELAQRIQEFLGVNPQAPTDGPNFDAKLIRPYMVAPLDVRWIYYDPRLLGRARYGVMQHMLKENIGLVFMRQCTGDQPYDHFLATRTLVSDRVFHSAHGAPFLAPLFLYDGAERTSNINPEFVADFAARLSVTAAGSATRNGRSTLSATDVFCYLYAVVHGREYRRRYGDLLRRDFPRLPLTDDRSKFLRLSRLGRQLLDVHLGETVGRQPAVTVTLTAGDNVVAPRYPRLVLGDEAGGNQTARQRSASRDRLLINPRQWFQVVGQSAASLRAAWEFRVGGQRVLAKWLSGRRGRCLAANDLTRIGELLSLARRTRRLVDRIDAAG